MNLYNNKISRRTNKLIREKIVMPSMRKRLQKEDFTILCNSCTGGFILHDLGLRFDTPTINMFFRGMDFFDFIENFDYYINQKLKQIDKPRGKMDKVDYPVAVLDGGEDYKTIELHFLHYKNFEEANAKWESRKQRIHFDSIYVIWTFMGFSPDEDLCKRAENLPVKNKVIFVNHPVDENKYPSFFYVKGFENEEGVGLTSNYMNLKGERYYDQFDFIRWLNEGK